MRLSALALVASASLLAGGCIALVAGAAAGAGGYVYVRGEGKQNFPHDVETVFNASVITLEKDMQISIWSKAHDMTVGTIDATRADGNKVKIRLKSTGEGVTEVRVRVGTIGDKDWTQLFFEKLKARL